VRFLSQNTLQITFKLNGLKDVEIFYGFVPLFTKDVSYLPMAYQFSGNNIHRKVASKKESIKIKNPFIYDEINSKYLAFICSIQDYGRHSYEAQIIADNEEKKAKEDDDFVVKLSLSIVGIVILLIVIGIVIYYFVKKKKYKKTVDLDKFIKQEDNENNNEDNNNNNEDNNNNEENLNEEENNIDSQIENSNLITNSNYNSISSDNNKNNNKNNNSNNKTKYIRKFDDDEDEDDRRLYKSFSED
jgi:hypothetical protein